VTSRSTSATTDNGTPPTYGTLLAVVTVANGFSTITNSNIADKRVRTGFKGNWIDANGNEIAKSSATASAVNEVTFTNAATGTNPTISATGDDTNIGLTGVPKGSGVFSGFMATKIGNLTPSGTGNLAVTGLGFKPKLVRFSVRPSNSTTNTQSGYGAMDSAGNQYARAWASTTTADASSGSTSACILLITAGGAVTQQAAFVSMDTGGFTVNFSSQNGTAVDYEAVG